MNIKPGDKIPLVAHLDNYAGGTFYVDVTVKRQDRSEIAGSPFDLVDEGDGIFYNFTVTMPDEESLTATYRVYEDAAKTIISNLFFPLTIIYSRFDAGNEILVTNIPDRIVAQVMDSSVSISMRDQEAFKADFKDASISSLFEDETISINTNQDQFNVESE